MLHGSTWAWLNPAFASVPQFADDARQEGFWTASGSVEVRHGGALEIAAGTSTLHRAKLGDRLAFLCEA